MSGYVAPIVAASMAYAAERLRKKRTQNRLRSGFREAVLSKSRSKVARSYTPLRFSSLNKAVHYFDHTLVYSTQIQSGPTATGGNGFANLAGTTANTSNPGLLMYFSPSTFTLQNANSGGAIITQNNSSYYSGIFEQVKLLGVTIKVFYTANYAATSLSTTVPFLPIMQYVKDEDAGISAPTSATTIADYPDMRTCQLGTSAIGKNDGCSLMWKFKPKISQNGSTAGTASMIINERNDWLSCENSGITGVYYGALFYLDCEGLLTAAATTAAIGNVTFYVTLHTAFKGLR